MKFEKAMSLVRSEIERAQTIHPEWPPDPVLQAAIIAEEAGELVQASLNLYYDKGNQNRMITYSRCGSAVSDQYGARRWQRLILHPRQRKCKS